MTETEFLLDTLRYFSEDTNRRCTGDPHANIGVAPCYYNPAKAGKEGVSEGCAIGRFMTAEQKATADEREAIAMLGTEGYVANGLCLKPSYIPESLKDLDKVFLRDVQRLHDDSCNWGENVFVGYASLRSIINRQKLNAEDFREFLGE